MGVGAWFLGGLAAGLLIGLYAGGKGFGYKFASIVDSFGRWAWDKIVALVRRVMGG